MAVHAYDPVCVEKNTLIGFRMIEIAKYVCQNTLYNPLLIHLKERITNPLSRKGLIFFFRDAVWGSFKNCFVAEKVDI